MVRSFNGVALFLLLTYAACLGTRLVSRQVRFSVGMAPTIVRFLSGSFGASFERRYQSTKKLLRSRKTFNALTMADHSGTACGILVPE